MARPLKVGVQLPEVEYEPRWTDLAEMARTAEDIGLDSVWVGDHYLYRDAQRSRGPWEAWTQLAAIAAITSRVEIGPLVASTSFHEPAVLAKLAATVDEISGGRLILGLGAGWNETEYAAFGFAFDHRVSRFEEAFTPCCVTGTSTSTARTTSCATASCCRVDRDPRGRRCSSAPVAHACCASPCPTPSSGTPGTRCTATAPPD